MVALFFHLFVFPTEFLDLLFDTSLFGKKTAEMEDTRYIQSDSEKSFQINLIV